ncbi:Uncharacterised protein [Candidatus Anstonella stagnisolia]|nr:Uncharacterised protein [Candidatus Anstonella stagnisolia]
MQITKTTDKCAPGGQPGSISAGTLATKGLVEPARKITSNSELADAFLRAMFPSGRAYGNLGKAAAGFTEAVRESKIDLPARFAQKGNLDGIWVNPTIWVPVGGDVLEVNFKVILVELLEGADPRTVGAELKDKFDTCDIWGVINAEINRSDIGSSAHMRAMNDTSPSHENAVRIREG